MRIGEVLAGGDLELPGIVPRRKQGTLFGWLVGWSVSWLCMYLDGVFLVLSVTGALLRQHYEEGQTCLEHACMHRRCKDCCSHH